MTGFDLLAGLRVVELATQIAGPYCGKLLVDAGAEVVKVEPADGDPLRRWSASGHDLGGGDSPLFAYLNASKRSVVAATRSPELDVLAAGAHLLVHSGQLTATDVDELRGRHPHLSVVSVTPFGVDSPWAGVPVTEFVLQALCGSIAGRGDLDREPFHVGGRLGEWGAGAYAAAAAVALLLGWRRWGRSDHADVSMIESMALSMTSMRSFRRSMMSPGSYDNSRSLEVPGIEPTSDGYVGFSLATRQQFNDLLALVERPDLIDDDDLASTFGRRRRRVEFLEIVHRWTTARTTDEVVEIAAALRVPAVPIGTPETILDIDHFVERDVFVPADGARFRQPRAPYLVDGRAAATFGRAPELGEASGTITWEPVEHRPHEPARLPLEGVSVVDLTAFWAGPAATQLLAALGADVIKVESVQRPDGMRFTGCRPRDEPDWWEWGYFFQGVNQNKRGITLDLTTGRGRQLLLELVRASDLLLENFTPRVLDNFGLSADVLHAANPRLVVTRMPAFGLSGPWRDRSGFAQTMEQASGIAWMTGFPDGPPVVVPGFCDPIAGVHAAFATVAALVDRERSGDGHLLECPMIEAALNVAAELVIERTAHGVSLQRAGNRGPVAAPQGLYRCGGPDSWIAVAVRDDAEWRALAEVIDVPAPAQPDLATKPGRIAHADEIDTMIATWAADLEPEQAVATLRAAGVPAAPVVDGERVDELEPLRDSGFLEPFDHPVVGRHEVFTLPFRLASRTSAWIRFPSPRLGQHNEEVLRGLLGLDDAALATLREQQVIGERPIGA